MALQIKDNLAYLKKKNTHPASGKGALKLFAQVLAQISIESSLRHASYWTRETNG